MKEVTSVKWNGNTIIVKNKSGTFKKTPKTISLEMWKFKVLGEIPKGVRVKKVTTN